MSISTFLRVTIVLVIYTMNAFRDKRLILKWRVTFAWSCYYQLGVVSCSLNHDAIVILVQAFVTSRIDHWCPLLFGLPLWILLDPAIRLISLGGLLHFPLFLHTCMMCCIACLCSQQIFYCIAALVSHCCASSYLCDHCRPVSDVAARWVFPLSLSLCYEWFHACLANMQHHAGMTSHRSCTLC